MDGKYIVARFTKGGEHFEILVKPNKALAFKTSKSESIGEVIISETIFKDVKKGIRASEQDLERAFGTKDVMKIAEDILTKGILQLTAEQRRKLIEDKRKQIVAYISRQTVDPKTGLPHPPTRIEQALQHIKYSIDINKSVEEQAQGVIKLLRPLLPLKIENVTLSLEIPPQYIGKVYGVVRSIGTIKKEEWRADGSWAAVVEVPAGSYGYLLERLGELTKGNVISKLLR